eukprot:TRINITY_DN8263_c0_g1_i1.p1 TRINITY_DN8263_c0_g1~~TRINITY_DN8263_c0_g1_i1.p1  ORF type:complete len:592 (-),score=200.44 TRINITY_DN8263_c0_g1_i1:124-1899(-)
MAEDNEDKVMQDCDGAEEQEKSAADENPDDEGEKDCEEEQDKEVEVEAEGEEQKNAEDVGKSEDQDEDEGKSADEEDVKETEADGLEPGESNEIEREQDMQDHLAETEEGDAEKEQVAEIEDEEAKIQNPEEEQKDEDEEEQQKLVDEEEKDEDEEEQQKLVDEEEKDLQASKEDNKDVEGEEEEAKDPVGRGTAELAAHEVVKGILDEVELTAFSAREAARDVINDILMKVCGSGILEEKSEAQPRVKRKARKAADTKTKEKAPLNGSATSPSLVPRRVWKASGADVGASEGARDMPKATSGATTGGGRPQRTWAAKSVRQQDQDRVLSYSRDQIRAERRSMSQGQGRQNSRSEGPTRGKRGPRSTGSSSLPPSKVLKPSASSTPRLRVGARSASPVRATGRVGANAPKAAAKSSAKASPKAVAKASAKATTSVAVEAEPRIWRPSSSSSVTQAPQRGSSRGRSPAATKAATAKTAVVFAPQSRASGGNRRPVTENLPDLDWTPIPPSQMSQTATSSPSKPRTWTAAGSAARRGAAEVRQASAGKKAATNVPTRSTRASERPQRPKASQSSNGRTGAGGVRTFPRPAPAG